MRSSRSTASTVGQADGGAGEIRAAVADTLKLIGSAYRDQGELAEAQARYEQALLICREVGDSDREAATLETSFYSGKHTTRREPRGPVRSIKRSLQRRQ